MTKIPPPEINELIDKLGNLNFIDNNLLVKIIEKLKITEESLLQYAVYNHKPDESYGRRRIYRANNFEIFVMSWMPGDFTAIHNHGHSEWGIVYFLGNALHRSYESEENKLKLTKTEIIPIGTIAPVCGNLTHSMGNSTDKPFITLHIYGSNSYEGIITEDSKIFDVNNNRIITTTGPAYINMKEEYCKNIDTGIETDENTKKDFDKLISQSN